MKKKYRMVAFSSPLQGKEEAFNKWTQDIHIPEVVSAYGFTGAQRFKLGMALAGNSQPYMTIYEIETDDIGKSLGEVGAKATTRSDAIDYGSATAIVYEEVGTRVNHGDPVKR
jgi:hypothetical protein